MTAMAIWFLWAALIYFSLFWICLTAHSANDTFRPTPFEDFKLWPDHLLRRGYDGGQIRLIDKATGRFIRLQKYISLSGLFGIRLTFPSTGWGQQYVSGLTGYCRENGLTLTTPETVGEDIDTFVEVDCRQDADLAWKLARMIWVDLFGLTDKQKCASEASDMSPLQETIRSLDHPRKDPLELYYRNVRKFERQFGMPFGPAIFWMVFSLFGLIVSSLALPIVALLSIGDPPDWIFSVGAVTMGGSDASAVLWLLHAASAVLIFGFAILRKGPRPVRSWIRKIVGYATLLFEIGLLTAVVVIWSAI